MAEPTRKPASFREAAEAPPRGSFRDFLDYLLHNRKWWLAPIVMVLLVLALLVVLSGSGVAPFIYSLF